MPLSICIFAADPRLTQSLETLLSDERYSLHFVPSEHELLDYVEAHRDNLDCLIALQQGAILPIFNQLYERGLLFPLVIIVNSSNQDELGLEASWSKENPTFFYHLAEIRLSLAQIDQIIYVLDQAIARFLHLNPQCVLSDPSPTPPQSSVSLSEEEESFLLLQQRRLAEKLKERLGYLGVYYKRKPEYFYRNLSQEERKELDRELKANYQEIILNYFTTESDINDEIDQFVNRVFFADIAISAILEIHMELMDEFSQQLKLEGRNEDILLDYRLTLIDILAHLGEMYRRSIPREDLQYNL